MVEFNSNETHNIYPNLSATPLNDQQHQFRLYKINEIKDYIVAEISKYIAFFDYFDKSLIVLSVATGSISIASFSTVIRTPVGIVSACFSLAFPIFTEL